MRSAYPRSRSRPPAKGTVALHVPVPAMPPQLDSISPASPVLTRLGPLTSRQAFWVGAALRLSLASNAVATGLGINLELEFDNPLG